MTKVFDIYLHICPPVLTADRVHCYGMCTVASLHKLEAGSYQRFQVCLLIHDIYFVTHFVQFIIILTAVAGCSSFLC